jgi:pilus assembly protein CpaB
VGRRVVLLIAAFVIAAVGTGLVFVYVKRADDRALAGQQPVEVLVAKSQISSGTQVSEAVRQGAFETRRIPLSAASTGALSTIEPIKDSVALTTVFPGQQILSGMFGSSVTDTATSSLPLPAGAMAMSFQFTDPARVAGFVQPGSRVAIFVTVAPQARAGGDNVPSGGAAGDLTRVLLPSAKVIAVGPTTVTQPTDPKQANTEAVPRALLTLALDEKQAAKLVFASAHGTLYLGLLNDKSKVTAGTAINATSLFQ